MTPSSTSARLSVELPTVDLPVPEIPADVALRSDADPGLRLTAFLYQQLFQRPATLFTTAPGGLTLFGRPGDRFALAIPVRWGATVAASPRDDGVVDLRSGGQAGAELTRAIGDLGELPGWAARALAVVSRLTAAGHPLGGMSLLVSTILPEDAGMQADVALTTAMASTIGGLYGVEVSLADRAALGDLPAQMAALSCPDDTAMLVDTLEMTAELVPCDLSAAGLRLMIIDLGGTVDPVATGAPDLALAAVEQLRWGNVAALGPLLGRGTDLSAGAALVVDAACAAGALGAGTLPGGCLVALVPVACLSRVRMAVTTAWPTERPPKFLTAVSSRGGCALPGDASEDPARAC